MKNSARFDGHFRHKFRSHLGRFRPIANSNSFIITWRLFPSLQVSFPMARGGWPAAGRFHTLQFHFLHFCCPTNFQSHFSLFHNALKLFVNSSTAHKFQIIHFPQEFSKNSLFWPSPSNFKKLHLGPNLCFDPKSLCFNPKLLKGHFI